MLKLLKFAVFGAYFGVAYGDGVAADEVGVFEE